MIKPRNKGRQGERFVRKLLEDSGHRILSTNYFCPYGELDIVAIRERHLLFIEVKARSSLESLEQTLRPGQARTLRRSARHFLQNNGLEEHDYQILIYYVLIPPSPDQPFRLVGVKDLLC